MSCSVSPPPTPAPVSNETAQHVQQSFLERESADRFRQWSSWRVCVASHMGDVVLMGVGEG